jgi:protein SCO1
VHFRTNAFGNSKFLLENVFMTTRRTLLAGFGGAALSPVFAASRTAQPASESRPEGYFPNAIFQTHEGKKVKFYDDLVKGKLVVFNMMLQACSDGICPNMTANLRRVQQALGARVGKDIFMYSITLLPEHDTPKSLNAYAKAFGVQPGWTFLTGTPKDTDVIRRKLGFYDLDEKKDADKSTHTGMIRIGNEAYNRWCMVPALSTPKMIKDAILSMSV